MVDVGRCEGHGRCQAVAPDIFQLDATAVSTVRRDPVPADMMTQAVDGVRACPVAALSISDTMNLKSEGEEDQG